MEVVNIFFSTDNLAHTVDGFQLQRTEHKRKILSSAIFISKVQQS